MCETSTPVRLEKALYHVWSYPWSHRSFGKVQVADVMACPTVNNCEVALRTSFTSLCSHALKAAKFPCVGQYGPAMSASLNTSHMAIVGSVAYRVMSPRSNSTRCAYRVEE